MKRLIVMSALLPLIITGCRLDRRGDVVKESYIHKYGVPVSKEDWAINGKEGKVVSLLRDGVTMTRNFAQGILQGKTTYTFPNSSTIARMEEYEHGELISKIENYPSGVPKIEEIYQGKVLSKLTHWYEDGTPSSVESFDNGFLSSGEYRTPLNAIESRVEQGMGIRVMRDINNVLIARDTIRSGLMVERINYYENGEPSAITPYENGQIHGTKLTYLPGGVPSSAETWIHGKQEGVTAVYQNGEKIAEVPYVQGEKNGTEYRFKDGTAIVEELQWKHGIQHGPRKIIVDGKEAKCEWYHEGKMVSRATYERMNVPGRS